MALWVTPVLKLLEIICGKRLLLTSSFIHLIVELSILIGSHTLHQTGCALHPSTPRITDPSLSTLPSLRCNKDDSISSLRAVDGSGGSILEDGEALDVIWVEHIEGT